MKRSLLVNILVMALVLTIGGTGCKHKPKGLTVIPGQKVSSPQGTAPGPFIPSGPSIPQNNRTGMTDLPPDRLNNPGGIKQAGLTEFEGMLADRETFKAYTIYFDFDRSEVKTSERTKLDAVVDFMKKAPEGQKLLIEGHCDERGTEEYNRALGERRALSAREYLANAGFSSQKIRTISYGKDVPADPGHNESAWGQNRRCEFLLLLPKQ